MTFQGNARVSSSNLHPANRTQLRQAVIEALEQRQLLSVPAIQGVGSTDSFGAQVIPAKKGLILPIRGNDASGDPITYKVTSSNKAFKVNVFKNNPYWKLDVYTTVRSGSNYPTNQQTPAGQTAVSGEMTFQLFKNLTPKTVAYISGLTQSGFYDNLTFHRLDDLSGSQASGQYILQGGDPQGNGQGGPGFQFEDEFVKNLLFSGQDQLAMANSGPDTNGSQFFITSKATRHLDYKHTIFGQMIRGQDTLQKLIDIGFISSTDSTLQGKPNQDIHIRSAQMVQDTQDAVMMVTAPASGSTWLTITATDAQGNATAKKVQVVARKDGTNEPQFFSPIPNDGVTPVGTPYSINLHAYDAEGDKPVWSGQFLNGTHANAVLEGDMLTIVPFPGYQGPIVMKLTATEANSQQIDAETITVGVGTKAFPGSKGLNINAVSGASKTFRVATFTSTNPKFTTKDFNTQINWGDSNVAAGTVKKISKTTYAVMGTNSFKNEGEYTVNVLISDKYGAITKTASTATVSDAALTPVSKTIYGTQNVNLPSNPLVGSFIDSDPKGQSSDYTATIDWGDGTTSAATVSPNSSSSSTTGGVAMDVLALGTHKYVNPGTYAIKVAVKDKGGSSTTIYSTANIGWSGAVLSFAGSTISEGGKYTTTGTFTDNVSGTGWSATVDYGDGLGTKQLILKPDPTDSKKMTFDLSNDYVDGGGTSTTSTPYTVRVVVTDQAGHSANAAASVTVNNVAPTMTSLTGSTTDVVVGQPAWLFMSADDVSPADVTAGFSYKIAWDNVGNPNQTSTTASKATSASNVYTTPGTYTAKVWALDQSKTQSTDGLTWTIKVVPAALMPDLLEPAKQSLIVGGTSGGDTISIVPDPAGGVDAIVNANKYGPFNPTARIKVYGYAGNDLITVDPSIKTPVELYGGDGDDTLKAGGGNSVLIGGAGNDILRGGAGRNVLIGNAGKDSLTAGSGGDILIAGSTAFDSNSASIEMVSNEWSSNASYANRLSHLTGGKGGLNGNAFLVTKKSKVTSDSDEDVLTGSAGQDLFYAQTKTATKDILKGKATNETLFELPAPFSYNFG